MEVFRRITENGDIIFMAIVAIAGAWGLATKLNASIKVIVGFIIAMIVITAVWRGRETLFPIVQNMILGLLGQG